MSLRWRKSSYSGNGGNCVEAAPMGLRWRKSSYSGNDGDCVEVAPAAPVGVAVRDSKDPGGGVLMFTADEWRAFAAGLKAGDFGAA